jgi:hypothetical protein
MMHTEEPVTKKESPEELCERQERCPHLAICGTGHCEACGHWEGEEGDGAKNRLKSAESLPGFRDENWGGQRF